MIGWALGRAIGGRFCSAGVTLAVAACGLAGAATPTPADTFMQSVVRRDATLGWQQLCPQTQAQLPLAVVQDQAAAQRIAEAGAGVTLTLNYIGSQPRPGGGEIRVYIVTAHFPDDRTERRTYTIQTEASGCVVSIE